MEDVVFKMWIRDLLFRLEHGQFQISTGNARAFWILLPYNLTIECVRSPPVRLNVIIFGQCWDKDGLENNFNSLSAWIGHQVS